MSSSIDRAKFPLRIIDEPAHDCGWYIADADGNELDPQAVVDALNRLIDRSQ